MFATRRPSRRHPFQSPVFWGLMLLGAAGMAVWQFGLAPSHKQVRVVEEELPPPVPLEQTQEWLPAQPAEVIPATIVELASFEQPVSELQATAENVVEPAIPSTRELLAQARDLVRQGDEIGAHRVYSTLYWQQSELVPEFFDEMQQLANKIYFESSVHYLPPRQIDFGERLESIAREFEVPWEYLAKLNHLDPHRIKAGQKMKVLRGPFGAIVDQDSMTLTVHAYGYYVRRYTVGIGRDQSTPVGMFRVVDKVVNPTYYGPTGVIADNDLANPLGERWLAINDEVGTLQGYGIHGTNDPASIEQAEPQGCIRLGEADILEIYDLLSVGSEVVIRPRQSAAQEFAK